MPESRPSDSIDPALVSELLHRVELEKVSADRAEDQTGTGEIPGLPAASTGGGSVNPSAGVAAGDQQFIPKSRFDEVNVKFKQAAAERDLLLRERAAWEQRVKDVSNQQQDKKPAAAPTPTSTTGDEVARLRNRQDAVEMLLAAGHKVSDEAVEILSQLRRETPALSRAETMLLARVRKPDLFGEAGAGGPPPSHFVQTPGRSSPPASAGQFTSKDVIDAMANTRDAGELDTLGATLVSRLLQEHPDIYIKKD